MCQSSQLDAQRAWYSFAILTSFSLLCGCGVFPVPNRTVSPEQAYVRPIAEDAEAVSTRRVSKGPVNNETAQSPSLTSRVGMNDDSALQSNYPTKSVAIDYPRLSPKELDYRHQLHSVDGSDATRADLSISEKLLNDQLHFYSVDSMANLGLAFGAGALIANTGTDEAIQRHFQASVRNATSDEWFEFLHLNKELGNGVVTLPIFGSLWLADELLDGPPAFEAAGKWGERSMRAFIVGAPPLILAQRLTGGSRPYETEEGSHWQPFRDNNGVSGHAFMSSLPFITAAKMTNDPWKKSMWYGASALGPLSRVNDNAHYTSQVGLGWAIAYVAATAVNQTDTGKKGWSVISNSTGRGSEFALQYRW